MARVFRRYLAVFSKHLTAARFFKEGTGPASFNSNPVNIATAWLRARDCYTCLLPCSLLVHFSWGKAITTANDRRTVSIFKCENTSVVLHCIMCKYCPIVMEVRENRSMIPLNFVQRRASPNKELPSTSTILM